MSKLIDKALDQFLVWIVSLPYASLVWIILGWISSMPPWLIVVCGFLFAIPPFAGVLYWQRLKSADARMYARWSEAIPEETDLIPAWESKTVAMLRGRGLRQKARALQESLKNAATADKVDAAKGFMTGLIREAGGQLLSPNQ